MKQEKDEFINCPLYTFTITANQGGDWDNRPVVHLLPHRVKDIEVVEGGNDDRINPIFTDLIENNSGKREAKTGWRDLLC